MATTDSPEACCSRPQRSVKPIDYSTDDLELGASFTAEGWQASLTYYGSFFENRDTNLTWDNPFTGSPGAEAGSLALPPDNESHQLALAGSLRLPARTIVSGQLSVGALSQDEALLPYTINPLLETNPLPATSVEAEADTLNLNLRAVTSPWRKLTFEGELRYNDFDNNTPIRPFDYVVTDAAPAVGAVENLTYDYQRRVVKLRGEYRASSRHRFHLGFDTKKFDRSFQERSETDTNRLWFTYKTRIGHSGQRRYRPFYGDS